MVEPVWAAQDSRVWRKGFSAALNAPPQTAHRDVGVIGSLPYLAAVTLNGFIPADVAASGK